MIILTGASGGIGKELLNPLMDIDDVVALYNTSKPKDPVNDSRLSYHQLDLQKPEDIKSFVKEIGKNEPKISLVHSAALSVDGLAANYAELDWDRVMNVNLKGNFLLTQALLPLMIQEQWGRVIHVSSFVGAQGACGTIAYSASKTGLIGMSRVLAKEYARFNVTSNILVLGYFEKGLIDTLTGEAQEKVRNLIPSKTFGNVSNIVNAIEFLIKSEYVNGATINIDGGI